MVKTKRVRDQNEKSNQSFRKPKRVTNMKSRLTVVFFLTGLCSLSRCLPRQYHLISPALSWSEARAVCRERHSDLATVSSMEDMKRLLNAAQDSRLTGQAWIGLHRHPHSWRWSNPDQRYHDDYRNWDLGQPGNFGSGQTCVMMTSRGLWVDSSCLLKKPFVCYDGTSVQRLVLVEQLMIWSEAQRYCREQHTDLVSVRDQEENQEVQSLITTRSVWIGLHRGWEWSDGSESGFRHWRAGQPDEAGRESCTATDLDTAGLWSDQRCSQQLLFFCYGQEEVTSNQFTTTETPNIKSTSTAGELITQNSSSEVDQRSTTTYQTIYSTAVTTNIRTSSEPTTGHVSTDVTLSETPSTTEDQTTTTTNETPNLSALSTTERDSTSSGDSSQQPSTPTAAQRAADVVYLRLKLTSETPLSDDEVTELLLVQFYNLLVEKGLPSSIKVGLKKPLK